MTKLKIASWNVNSVRARSDIVCRLLDEEQPDILCLQETKCVDDAFPRDKESGVYMRPDKVHLLVPRRSRGLRRPPGVVIHTRPDDEKVSTVWRYRLMFPAT